MRKVCFLIFFLIISLGIFFPPSFFAATNQKKKTRQATPPISSPRIDTSERLALVIGNSAYQFSPLKNPVNDASDLSSVLKELGFTVILRTNADLRSMGEALEEFGNRLKRGGVGLFFYAGHAVQIDGVNYLIPVRAKVNKETDVRYEALDTGRVMAEMAEAKTGLNIVILDSCRNNPFASKFRSPSSGLAGISKAPLGTFISYSTGPGEVADDGDARNSPYTEALLETIKQPGLPIEQVFKRVRQKINSATGGKQTPWDTSSLQGEFYFNPVSPIDTKSKERKQVAVLAVQGQNETDKLKEEQKAIAEENAQIEAGRKRLKAERLKEEKERKQIEAEKKREEERQRFEEEKAKKAEKAAWDAKLKNMKTAFGKAEIFEKKKVAPDLKIATWQRFLDAFEEKNPYSDEDARLREKAEKQIQYWQEEKVVLGIEQKRKMEKEQNQLEEQRQKVAEERARLGAKKKEEEERRKQTEEQMLQEAESVKREKEQKQLDAQKKREEDRQRIQEEKHKLEEEKMSKETVVTPSMHSQPLKGSISSSIYVDQVTDMEFILVKGGCYQMGDTFGDGNSDEKPVHEVCVDDFYMGKYEVTQKQWMTIMGNNPSYFKWGNKYPVEQVSWNDVQDFIQKLNQKASRNHRLPTEAEWEYAARSGGKMEKWAGTNSEADLGDYSWYSANSSGSTNLVGKKKPNGLELYDMSGNVWEWVQDHYDTKAYNLHSRINPLNISGSSRVIRGGSWFVHPKSVRSANRYGYDSQGRYRNIGFRLVLQK